MNLSTSRLASSISEMARPALSTEAALDRLLSFACLFSLFQLISSVSSDAMAYWTYPRSDLM
jgi:hypothetical protein